MTWHQTKSFGWLICCLCRTFSRFLSLLKARMSEGIRSEGSLKSEVDREMVGKLSEGLVGIFEPTLKSVRHQLVEIVKKQEFLHDELHNENLKLSQSIYSSELQQMFDKVRLYKEKLTAVKKTMMALHKQSADLKKRALRLEQMKQREALHKVHKREYEELLIKKPPT